MKKLPAILLLIILAAALPASADMVLEDFSNATTGSYNAYGGNNLGDGSGYLSGWAVGGRYFDITSRGGGIYDITGTAGYGKSVIGTALDANEDPSYEAGDALDLSNSTYLDFTFTNNNAFGGNFVQYTTGDKIYMHFYDTSAATTASVALFETSVAIPSIDSGATDVVTVMLADITGFDKTADKVFGFVFNGHFGYCGGGNNAGLSLQSITYDAPVAAPEPATLVLLGIGGLAMSGAAIRRRRA